MNNKERIAQIERELATLKPERARLWEIVKETDKAHEKALNEWVIPRDKMEALENELKCRKSIESADTIQPAAETASV